MAPVRLAIAALALSFTRPLYAKDVAHWRPYITDASLRFGIPESWIDKVMQAESGGEPIQGGRPIRSRVGAMGLMQIMPGTWAFVRSALALGINPDDPRDNILAGAFYLRQMYDRFGYPGLFAAYNVGPKRYAAHLATGQPLPSETVIYMRKVGGTATSTSNVKRQDVLFVSTRGAGSVASVAARDPAVPGLFAIKNDDP